MKKKIIIIGAGISGLSANINFVSNNSVLEEYLPWADKVQLQCKISELETNLKEKNSSE